MGDDPWSDFYERNGMNYRGPGGLREKKTEWYGYEDYSAGGGMYGRTYSSFGDMLRDAWDSTPENGWSITRYNNGSVVGHANGTYNEETCNLEVSEGSSVFGRLKAWNKYAGKHLGGNRYRGAFVYGYEALIFSILQGAELEWEDELIDLSDPNSGMQIADFIREHFTQKRKNRSLRNPFLHEFIDLNTKLGQNAGYGPINAMHKGKRKVLGKWVEITIHYKNSIKGGKYDPTNVANQVYGLDTDFGSVNPANDIMYSTVDVTNNDNAGALIRFQVINDPEYVKRLRAYLLGD